MRRRSNPRPSPLGETTETTETAKRHVHGGDALGTFGSGAAKRVALLLALSVLAACSEPGSSSAPSTTQSSPPTTEVETTQPPTSSTSTTEAPTTSTVQPPPTQELAGARTICSYSGLTVPNEILGMLAEGKASGVLWFKSNIPNQQTAETSAAAIQAAAIQAPGGLGPAIITIDQEGGQIRRVDGPPQLSASELGRLSTEEITQHGVETAEVMLSWGANFDLAPVADVARAGSFLVSQQRSFSDDPQLAAEAVAAFVSGLHQGGVATTVKHFPGLGAAVTNTDFDPTEIDLSREQMNATDLPPFIAGIDAGTDAVMISSATYPAFDSVPAVLSERIINDLLRNELGFDGVVISDAFDAEAVKELGPIEEVVVEAANAGVDVFITATTAACQQIHQALAQAIDNGTIPLEDAVDSYWRVAELRSNLASN